MSYNYTVNPDQTRVSVTTQLDAFDARMHWPATSDVSRTVSLLVGRAVRCHQDGPGTDIAIEYEIETDTHPVAIAEIAYLVAEQAQLRVELQLDRARDLDDETPSLDVYMRSAEWRAASAEVRRTYEAYVAAQRAA